MPNPASTNEIWPEERIARLKELFAQGLPYSAMGEALGCTRNAAMGKAKRLGLSRPVYLQGGRPASLVSTRQTRGSKEGGEAFAVIKRIKSRREAHAGGMSTVRRLGKRKCEGYESYASGVSPISRPALNLAFMQLTNDTCKFECSSNDEPKNYVFCGHPVIEGKPYCSDHCKVVYVPVPKRTRPDLKPEFGRHRNGVFGRTA